MCEIVSVDADAVPMAEVIHGLLSNCDRDQTAIVPDDGTHCLTPDSAGDSRLAADSPAVAVVTGSKHSKWGKLRQTVKATTMFASTVSESAAAASGPASSRGSRRKLDNQADDRRDSFLKRFSTRQSSYGTSYLQVAAADSTLVSNSKSEHDGKV